MPVNSPELFRKNVQGKLRELEWSQSDLARAIGMAPSHLSNYLTGKNTPGLEVIDRIAAALHVMPSELLMDDREMAEVNTSIRKPTLEDSLQQVIGAVRTVSRVPSDILELLSTVEEDEWPLVRNLLQMQVESIRKIKAESSQAVRKKRQ